MSHQLHIANGLPVLIQAMVFPNENLKLADMLSEEFIKLAVDVFMTANTGSPTPMATEDVILKRVSELLMLLRKGTSPQAGKALTNMFAQCGVPIQARQVVEVLSATQYQQGGIFAPSFWASYFSATDVTVCLYVQSLNQIVSIETNSDYSWICRPDGVIRAKYGKLWVPAEDLDRHSWTQAATS